MEALLACLNLYVKWFFFSLQIQVSTETYSWPKIKSGAKEKLIPSRRQIRPTCVQNVVIEINSAFQKLELAGRTIARLSRLDDEIGFLKEFFFLLRASYVEFNRSGWIGLIKKKIQITTGMVWPVTWKAP